MLQVLKNEFANPSSLFHTLGQQAACRIQTARQQVAAALGCSPAEVIFTSGATESCNLAIKGVAAAYAQKGNHIVASATEHKAVLEPIKQLTKMGFEFTLVRPDHNGTLNPQSIQDALTPKTILVCVMAANNVYGAVNPIEDIGQICKKRGVLFFCDATQALGKMPFSLHTLPVDLAAFSSHKIYGPKGVGALFIRRSSPRVRLEPQIVGGGQEHFLRAGTENTPGIVGFAKACQLAQLLLNEQMQRLALLKRRLEIGILSAIPDAKIVAVDAPRLCNTTMIIFPHIPAQSLLRQLENRLCVSPGAACEATSGEAGYSLRALGLEQDKIHHAVRFSLGRFTTTAEIDAAIEMITAAWKTSRGKQQEG